MAKEKAIELSLMEKAEQDMQSMVEQHNELVNQLQELNGRLTEVKQMIVEHQGYMKGLKACNDGCEKDA